MPEIVICERQCDWAAMFRRHFDEIVESRTFDDCLQFIDDHPQVVVVIDSVEVDPWLTARWVARVRERHWQVLILAIVSRDTPRAALWLREAGAADLLTSFGDIPRVKRIVRRHFDRLTNGPLSLEQRIWNNLPWSQGSPRRRLFGPESQE